jgi:hypothetical protein
LEKSVLIIYADESGDLGWTFDQPYGRGGSSRYLTIFAVLLPENMTHHPERLIRHLYKSSGWNPKKEKKWVDTPTKARTSFVISAAKLKIKHPEIKYAAIVVSKTHVRAAIRRDANKLYNYMLRLLLLDEMAKHPYVTFIPDPRSIKVESGHSLHDYLELSLLFDKGADTQLTTLHQDSQYCLNLQFADMMAGVVQSYFEFGKADDWDIIAPHITLHTLFFTDEK